MHQDCASVSPLVCSTNCTTFISKAICTNDTWVIPSSVTTITQTFAVYCNNTIKGANINFFLGFLSCCSTHPCPLINHSFWIGGLNITRGNFLIKACSKLTILGPLSLQQQPGLKFDVGSIPVSQLGGNFTLIEYTSFLGDLGSMAIVGIDPPKKLCDKLNYELEFFPTHLNLNIISYVNNCGNGT